MIEAKKLAFADRAKYYADPEFAKVPVEELIVEVLCANNVASRFTWTDRPADIAAGDPKLGRADTMYFCVVDKDRNCVSLIQSNYGGFGSGVVPVDLGFGLQNRGTLFALDEKHANRLEPHKRPFHTIIPAMVTKDGKPWLAFGVMGGDMQPQGHVQVWCNMIDFGMNVQAAGEAPRVEHVGSATPTGRPAKGVGTVKAEPRLTGGRGCRIGETRASGRAREDQFRWVSGDFDRTKDRDAARRHGGTQRWLCGGILNHGRPDANAKKNSPQITQMNADKKERSERGHDGFHFSF